MLAGNEATRFASKSPENHPSSVFYKCNNGGTTKCPFNDINQSKKLFMEPAVEKKLIVCTLAALTVLHAAFTEDTKDYDRFFTKNYAIKVDVGTEYNYWIPDKSNYLDYDTTGLSLLKTDLKVTHNMMYLPEFHVNYETSLSGSNSSDILKEQEKNDGLKAAYNKLNLIAGWGKRIADYDNKFNYYNPWRPNSKVELFYSRETFRISVKPTVSDLYYVDYDGTVSQFSTNNTLTMYTKFEEMQLNFDTKGFLIMPCLLGALFGDPNTVTNITNIGLDTQLGAYYDTWQKPYSTSQILTAGDISGYDNVVYDSKFQAAGLVEKFYYAGKYFYFDNQFNLGIAWVNLSSDETLSDSSAPIFMQFKIRPTAGFHLPLFKDRLCLNVYGTGEWGCLVGVASNQEGTSALTITSFINSDVLLKTNFSVTYIY